MFNSYRENTSSGEEAGASTGRRGQPGVVTMRASWWWQAQRGWGDTAPRGGDQDELVKCGPRQTGRTNSNLVNLCSRI